MYRMDGMVVSRFAAGSRSRLTSRLSPLTSHLFTSLALPRPGSRHPVPSVI